MTTRGEQWRASGFTMRQSGYDEAAATLLEAWSDGAHLEGSALDIARATLQLYVHDSDRLRTILGHCPTAIAVLDESGLLIGHNRAFLEVSSAEPVLESSALDLVDPADRDAFLAVVQAAGTDRRTAGLVRLRGEGARAVQVLAATLPAPDGSIGVVLAAEDRTDTIAGELRRAADLRESARAGSWAAMHLATATLVHDLANLLAASELSTGTLERSLRSEAPINPNEFLEVLLEVRRALEAGSALLRDARARLRGEAESGNADLAEAVEAAARIVLLRPRGVRLDVRADIPAGLRVALRRGELLQVLMNVLDNAAHAHEEASRGGALRVHASVDAEEMVRLIVADDGAGIEPKRLGEVLKPFSTTRASRGGTGLGLAIVRALVEEAGGHVSISSEPDVGTRVELHIPRAETAEHEPTGTGG